MEAGERERNRNYLFTFCISFACCMSPAGKGDAWKTHAASEFVVGLLATCAHLSGFCFGLGFFYTKTA